MSGLYDSKPVQIQIWMGELEPWWDENAVRQIWNNALSGDSSAYIPSIKVIKDRNAMSSAIQNSGYCFLNVKDSSCAARVVSFNGSPIASQPNKAFRLNWASSLQGNIAPKAFASQDYSLFVGDIANDLAESSLFEFFQKKFPSCFSARIMTDPITGFSKGYGFVKFSREQEANAALVQTQGAILNGRPIRVSTASKSGPSANSVKPALQPKVTVPPQQASPAFNQFSDPNNTTLFIGGLSSYVTAEELRVLFENFGKIVYVKIPPGKNCGFVQYFRRRDAEQALIQMQGYPLGHSRVRISWGEKAAQRAVYEKQKMAAMEELEFVDIVSIPNEAILNDLYLESKRLRNSQLDLH